jgi:hypothetical protein
MVIAVSPKCPISKANAQAYSRLVDKAVLFRLPVLVLADRLSAAEAYVQEFLPREAAAYAVPGGLSGLPIRSVPLVLLLDANRSLMGVWEGSLSAGQEAGILTALSDRHTLVRVGGTETTILDNSELRDFLAAKVLLDVRERDRFHQGHRPSAINIPYDELLVRAPIELSRFSGIVIDCSYSPPPMCSMATQVLAALDYRNAWFMNKWIRGSKCRTTPLTSQSTWRGWFRGW